MTLATTPFRKIVGCYVRTVHTNMPAKFEVCSFNRFELYTFNAQNRGSCDPGNAPFQKLLRVHVVTVPVNMFVRFGVRSVTGSHFSNVDQ